MIQNEEGSEINSIIFYNNIFFCGHKSGTLSAWMPDQATLLKCSGAQKIHDGAINKLYAKDGKIITCSQDGFVKVFDPNSNFLLIFEKNFESV